MNRGVLFRVLSFVGLLALISMLTFGFSSSGRVYAQDTATPAASSACPSNPDSTEQVVVGGAVNDGDTATGLVVVREVKADVINVYARCLQSGETLKATQNVNVWSGYPSLDYAQHDACMQAVADRNAADTQGSWAAGKTVTLDGKPIPTSCGSTSSPIRSTDDKQVVPKGTVVLQIEVDFGKKTEDVRAVTLGADTTTVFNPTYRLMQFVGYQDLTAAQADVCPQAQRDAATATLANGWNAGFTVTVNGGKALTGCPAA
jgi:hypothetical protein